MNATAEHSDKAQAVAQLTGWDLDTYAAEAEWQAVGLGPVGTHRDADALERSNWEVVLADLRERFGAEAVQVAHFRHWAVGWVDELVWDAGREDIAAAVQDWRKRLDSYPVADEEHYSELEMHELAEWLGYIVPAEAVAAVARELFDAYGASRVDDCPGEEVIRGIARELGYSED